METTLRRMIAACITTVVLAGAVARVSAQPALAMLEGVLVDETGGILRGATVRATGSATEATVTSNDDGGFAIRLPAGTYRVEASFQGFLPEVLDVTLAAGEMRAIDLSLEISPLSDTVTVTRASQSRASVATAVTVVGEADVRNGQRQDTLAESLRGTPGLFVENRRNLSLGGGVRAAIRAPIFGFDLRGIQLLQDGIPLTMADGTTQPTNVDLGSAARIEVVRGPSSVLYGNSAAGVISVTTEFPASDHLFIEPDMQFGSYGYQRQQFKAEGTTGRVSYLANYSHMQTDGFRPHSAAELNHANFIVRTAVSPNTEIRSIFNLFDMPFGESASTVNEADARNNPRSVRAIAFPQGWGEAATQGQGGVTVEHFFDSGQSFRVTGWGTWRDLRNPIPFRIIELSRSAGGLRSEYSGETQVGEVPVRWTTGLDLSSQHDDREEFANGGVPATGGQTVNGAQILGQLEEVFSIAPFAQVSATFDSRWVVTGGIRYDHYDFSATDRFLGDGDQSGGRTLSAVSPMVGLTYVASDELNLYTNFSTAYQTPTTVELSNRPTGEGGFNESLDPEDLRSFEVGVRGVAEGGRVQYEIAGYFAMLDSAFVEFQRPDEQVYYLNAGKTSRNGVEGRVEWRFRPDATGYLSYTYQNFEFDEFQNASGNFAGNKEPGAPPQQLYLGGSYAAPFGLESFLTLRWVDEYTVNTANTFFNWAYTVVDLRFVLNRKLGTLDVKPFFGIDNVFNERYNGSTIPNSLGNRFYEPSPGREFYGGLRFGASLF